MASNVIMTGLLVALSAGLMGAVPVDLCVEPSFEAAVAVMRLDEHSPGLDLRPVRPAACGAGDGYRARFRARPAGVVLVLWTPTGDRLERAVPWVERSEDAVIDLSRRGRLGAVAVLLSGLVLEDRALRAMVPRSLPLAAETQLAPRPAPGLEPTPAGGAALVVEQASDAPMPAPVERSPIRRRVVRRPRPAPPPRAPMGAATTTAARALANAAPRPEPSPRAAPPPEPAPFTERSVSAGGPGVSVTAPQPPPPERADDGGDPEARIGVGVGAALRAPSVLALEAAMRVEAWSLMLEVGGMPTIVWDLEGRPLELSAAWVAFGWTPRIWSRPAVEVDGRFGLVVERLTVLRLELPDAMTRAVWDAGVDLAAGISGPMGDGWRVGGLIGGRWLATGNDIRIPDGPRTALNAWQWRIGLVVDWAP